MGKAAKVKSTRSESCRIEALGRTRADWSVKSSATGPVKSASPFRRILAIDPTSSGFAFAVLEGKERLVDWGVTRVWAESDNEFLARLEALIGKYSPVCLVVEEPGRSKRGARARRRITLSSRFARSQKLSVCAVSWDTVRQTMGDGVSTKHEIASRIARHFPELAAHLPHRRRAWENEDPRINIFDAAAFAIAARPEHHKK